VIWNPGSITADHADRVPPLPQAGKPLRPWTTAGGGAARVAVHLWPAFRWRGPGRRRPCRRHPDRRLSWP